MATFRTIFSATHYPLCQVYKGNHLTCTIYYSDIAVTVAIFQMSKLSVIVQKELLIV